MTLFFIFFELSKLARYPLYFADSINFQDCEGEGLEGKLEKD